MKLNGKVTKTWVRTLALCIFTCILLGCSGTGQKQWQPNPTQLTYGINRRQLPPEPVYQRTRWVQSPSPLPSREPPMSSAGFIDPVIEIRLKRTTLEKAARALSASCGYRVYVASGVASKPVSIRQLGTVEELSQALADQTNSFVDVDHEDRAIRFLEARAVVPEFFEEGSLDVQEDASQVVSQLGSEVGSTQLGHTGQANQVVPGVLYDGDQSTN